MFFFCPVQRIFSVSQSKTTGRPIRFEHFITWPEQLLLPKRSTQSVLPSQKELGYFNTLSAGCFSCPQVEATPIMWYLSPGMRLLPGEPHQKIRILSPRNMIFTRGSSLKSNWATFGLVLSSNWAGFAEKTLHAMVLEAQKTVLSTSLKTLK